MVNAALWATKNKANLITFTGFNNKNPLKKINKKGINFGLNLVPTIILN